MKLDGRFLVTGGAGCIGSVLAENLLQYGDVVVIDNLSSGKAAHIEHILHDSRFSFIEGDITDQSFLGSVVRDFDVVFHLAANPDIKYKPEDPTDKDLNQNTLATYRLLEAMRRSGCRSMVFASSSTVYGEAAKKPTPEDYSGQPISLYGASKLACESLISSYCHLFGMKSWIFRFANIVGSRSRKSGSTVVADFVRKLKQNPSELPVLGNGMQSKPYLHVDECVAGMLFALRHSGEPVNLFNLSPSDSLSVNDIARMVVEELGLKGVRIVHAEGDRGWPGDVPVVLMDNSKLAALGWQPKLSSAQAMRCSVKEVVESWKS